MEDLYNVGNLKQTNCLKIFNGSLNEDYVLDLSNRLVWCISSNVGFSMGSRWHCHLDGKILFQN